MASYVLLQHFVVPEFWMYNLYVPMKDFETLVSCDELLRWKNNENIDDILVRLKGSPGVHYVCMVDYDVPENMMPEGVVITKYYMNVQCSS